MLWFAAGDARLSTVARNEIEDPANQPLVSVASVWEMAIKMSRGKLDVGMDLDAFVTDHIEGNGIAMLPISAAHATFVATLAFHHSDPFDRLIIAQAIVEGATIASCDSEFSKYKVAVIW